MPVPAPGWYQDPEGPAGQARYWDGSSWATRDPGLADAQPSHAPAAGSPRPRWLWPVVGIVVVALVVVLAWWGWPALFVGEEPGPETTTSQPVETDSDPSQEPVEPVPTEVGELDCTAARSTNFPQGPELRVAGIVVPFPHEDWGFRFDATQWTWIHDLHAWGTIGIEPRDEHWAAGIVAGRLQADHGFGAPEQAADAVAECLVTYGVFNTGLEMQVLSSKATTIDGMSGWHLRLAYLEGGTYEATEIEIITLDAAQPGNLAVVIGFHPRGHDVTAAPVQQAVEGITQQ